MPLLLVLTATLSLSAPPLGGECETPAGASSFGSGSPGSAGVPELRSAGTPFPATPYRARLLGGVPDGAALVLAGLAALELPLPGYGAKLYVAPPFVAVEAVLLGPSGGADVLAVPALPPSACGLEVLAQAAVVDPGAAGGAAWTAGLEVRIGVPTPPLFPGREFPAPGAVESVVLDLDGDPWLDAAVLLEWTAPDDVVLFRGVGSGLFEELGALTVGGLPVSLATGDLDGDGFADLVVGDDQVGVTVALGDGSGGFPSASLLPGPGSARDVQAADLDGDGHLDVLATAFWSDAVVVHLGHGDGTFEPAVVTPTGDGPEVLATGDLDADGALDVVVRRSIGSLPISVHLGTGDGALHPPTHWGGNVPGGAGVAVTDMDADGSLDVVFGRSQLGTRMIVLPGDGAGGFGPEVATYVTETQLDGFRVADLDDDGFPDVVSVFPNRFQIQLGEGDGTLSKPVQGHAEQPRSLVLADVDRDEQEDALVAAGDFLLVRTDLAELDPRVPFELETPADPTGVATGDSDGDGRPELFVAAGDEGVLVYEAVAGGRLGEPLQVVLPDVSYALAADDFDGDGLDDLAVTTVHLGEPPHPAEDGYVLLATGGGGFAIADTLTGFPNPRAILTADVDASGAPDLVVYDSADDTLSVLLGGGDGTFAPPVQVASALACCLEGLAAGDLNADGHLDLAGASSGAGVSLWFGAGDGTFTPAVSLPGHPNPFGIAVGDLDGDGLDDLVVAHRAGDELAVRLGVPGGGLGPPAVYPVGNAPDSVALADLDDDGHLDVAVGHLFEAAVLLGLGDGSLEPARRYAARISDLRVVDLDLDGLGDLAGRGPESVFLLFDRILD